MDPNPAIPHAAIHIRDEEEPPANPNPPPQFFLYFTVFYYLLLLISFLSWPTLKYQGVESPSKPRGVLFMIIAGYVTLLMAILLYGIMGCWACKGYLTNNSHCIILKSSCCFLAMTTHLSFFMAALFSHKLDWIWYLLISLIFLGILLVAYYFLWQLICVRHQPEQVSCKAFLMFVIIYCILVGGYAVYLSRFSTMPHNLRWYLLMSAHLATIIAILIHAIGFNKTTMNKVHAIVT